MIYANCTNHSYERLHGDLVIVIGLLIHVVPRLNAYYIFVHQYFPILPPPGSLPFNDDPLPTDAHEFYPSSPLALALLAIITLVPHPQDPDPRDRHSVLLRRQKAQRWAELAMEAIEIDADLLTSSTSPSVGLSDDPPVSNREPFHPRCPVELESLLAYLVLSTYEYAQRGNLVKCRNRASQAYDAAIRLGLQNIREDPAQNIFTEARRRAWWMTVSSQALRSTLRRTKHLKVHDRPTEFCC